MHFAWAQTPYMVLTCKAKGVTSVVIDTITVVDNWRQMTINMMPIVNWAKLINFSSLRQSGRQYGQFSPVTLDTQFNKHWWLPWLLEEQIPPRSWGMSAHTAMSPPSMVKLVRFVIKYLFVAHGSSPMACQSEDKENPMIPTHREIIITTLLSILKHLREILCVRKEMVEQWKAGYTSIVCVWYR